MVCLLILSQWFGSFSLLTDQKVGRISRNSGVMSQFATSNTVTPANNVVCSAEVNPSVEKKITNEDRSPMIRTTVEKSMQRFIQSMIEKLTNLVPPMLSPLLTSTLRHLPFTLHVMNQHTKRRSRVMSEIELSTDLASVNIYRDRLCDTVDHIESLVKMIHDKAVKSNDQQALEYTTKLLGGTTNTTFSHPSSDNMTIYELQHKLLFALAKYRELYPQLIESVNTLSNAIKQSQPWYEHADVEPPVLHISSHKTEGSASVSAPYTNPQWYFGFDTDLEAVRVSLNDVDHAITIMKTVLNSREQKKSVFVKFIDSDSERYAWPLLFGQYQSLYMEVSYLQRATDEVKTKVSIYDNDCVVQGVLEKRMKQLSALLKEKMDEFKQASRRLKWSTEYEGALSIPSKEDANRPNLARIDKYRMLTRIERRLGMLLHIHAFISSLDSEYDKHNVYNKWLIAHCWSVLDSCLFINSEDKLVNEIKRLQGLLPLLDK